MAGAVPAGPGCLTAVAKAKEITGELSCSPRNWSSRLRSPVFGSGHLRLGHTDLSSMVRAG